MAPVLKVTSLIAGSTLLWAIVSLLDIVSFCPTEQSYWEKDCWHGTHTRLAPRGVYTQVLAVRQVSSHTSQLPHLQREETRTDDLPIVTLSSRSCIFYFCPEQRLHSHCVTAEV